MDLYIFKSTRPHFSSLGLDVVFPVHLSLIIKWNSICKNMPFNFLSYILVVYDEVMKQVQSSLADIRLRTFQRYME
jgi:hypothetical protein